MTRDAQIRCGDKLEVRALPGLPVVSEGADLASIVLDGLVRASLALADGDVIAVASKLVSRAEGRFVDLRTVEPGERARDLAREVGKDERVIELVLRETVEISRASRGVLVVKNRLGVVCANAGVDVTNARPLGAPANEPEGSGPWALLLPEDPDTSAERLRVALGERTGRAIGVVITDSIGRPFRVGTVGIAVGVAGLPPVWDQRGGTDLFGVELQHTMTALADQVAAAADLVAGQAAEGRAVVHVRGLAFPIGAHSAKELVRPAAQDLYLRPSGVER